MMGKKKAAPPANPSALAASAEGGAAGVGAEPVGGKKGMSLRASRIRLLPVVIFVAVLMLSVRLGNLWQDVNGVLSSVEVGKTSAQAQAESEGAGGRPAPSITRLQTPLERGIPESGQQLAQGGGEEKPAKEGEKGAAKEGKDGKEGKESKKDSKKEGPSAVSVGPSTEGNDPLKDPVNFTQSEIELLQKLAERRELIDSRAQELEQREAMLKAAESRIDRKIGEMQQLQASIDGLLKKHDQQEVEKVGQLVKIYATMKPKDAAAIFNELDMPILMTVLENMKESSSAPILAAMLPEKARKVTEEMSLRRRIPMAGQ